MGCEFADEDEVTKADPDEPWHVLVGLGPDGQTYYAVGSGLTMFARCNREADAKFIADALNNRVIEDEDE